MELLPQEIFCKILDLTDVRSIYRSNSVCTSWQRRISEEEWGAAWDREEPWFLLQYKNKIQTNGDVYCEVWRPLSGNRFPWPHIQHVPPSALVATDADALSRWQASSHGLVASFSSKERRLTIWNPLTGVSKSMEREGLAERPDIWVDPCRPGHFQLFFYASRSMWIYDSEKGTTRWFNTPQRYLELGVKGCLLAASEQTDGHLCHVTGVSYLKQYLMDQRTGKNRWQSSVWPSEKIQAFEQRSTGRCGYIAIVQDPAPAPAPAPAHQGDEFVFRAFVYELVKMTCTWKLLGSTEVMSGRIDDPRPVGFIAGAVDHLLMVAWSPFSGYPPSSAPPRVFDLNDSTWKCFDSNDDVSVVAFFKPNLSAVP